MNAKPSLAKLVSRIVLPAMFLLVGNTRAQVTNNWIFPASGFWHGSATYWSASSFPSNGHCVFITNDLTKTVTINSTTAGSYPGTMTMRDLTVGAPTGSVNTLLLTGAGSTPLRVTEIATVSTGGVLTISNSILQVDGQSAPGTAHFFNDGDVTFNGGWIEVTNGNMFVGWMAPGQFTMNGGSNRVQQLEIGVNSVGTMTLAGGMVQPSIYFSVGQGAGSTGSVQMTGGLLDTRFGGPSPLLIVGGAGVGSLTANGGIIRAGDVRVGDVSTGVGDLTINGATFWGEGTFTVGRESGSTGSVLMAGGTLIVTNQPLVLGDAGYGRMVVSNGTVRLKELKMDTTTGNSFYQQVGGDVKFVSSAMTIGSNGQAIVSGGNLILTNAAGSGVITVSGGSFNFTNGVLRADNLIVTNGGTFAHGGGTLDVASMLSTEPYTVGDGTTGAGLNLQGGTNTYLGGLTISSRAILGGLGTVVVNTLTNAGTIAPGASAGQLGIDGDLVEELGAVLSIELGGLAQGTEYDFLDVTGSASLTGALDVALINGFTPDPANVFTVVHAGVTLSGSFSNLFDDRIITSDGRGWFALTWADGGSGSLILDDFQILAVPEPSVLLLLGTGLFVVIRVHRRLKRRRESS